ncbi:hypothetical protein AY600_02345 [Phormidium willei BDU 130791]|nr:hypothetical protein AY600_02345 [Phormidium willei BDU 130791]
MAEPRQSGEDAPSPRPGGRRLRDLAAVLPVAMLLLVLPPYVRIFDQDSFLGGVPLLFLYIFGLWALAILVSALVARGLARREMPLAQERERAGAKAGTQASDGLPGGRRPPEPGPEPGPEPRREPGPDQGREQGLEREV